MNLKSQHGSKRPQLSGIDNAGIDTYTHIYNSTLRCIYICVCVYTLYRILRIQTHTHTPFHMTRASIFVLCAVPPTTICFEKSISAEEERSASGKGGGIDVLTFPSEESSLPGFAMELEKGM